MRNTLSKFETIPDSPAPQIGIEEFADSSINIAYRYWVPTERFFELQYQVNLAVFNQLQEGKIDIPYPQREVTLTQAKS
ncbi:MULTISPECIES: mechanosensitive ion channel family protein [unclassified Neptuniibacter]|uniref:mechanosensitive ion channel family protein n=1 Tax=unclassified Neptuniibacter TaxID=2630693 RepID=UPI0025CFB767|nr:MULTISPECIES: mechanosensitive ion channel family protein [unclassified Neptuniibacter]